MIGGTSGHLLGGVLAAVLLGPSAAFIVLSSVLIVQALLFSDGGITALGANIFNMALIGTVVGWVIYRAISRVCSGLRGQLLAAAFAAWCTVVLAAVACAAETRRLGLGPLVRRVSGHGRHSHADRNRRGADHRAGARLDR